MHNQFSRYEVATIYRYIPSYINQLRFSIEMLVNVPYVIINIIHILTTNP